MLPFLIPSFLYLASLFTAALSFSVTVGSPPSQCGSLNLTWTGGQPPFEIMLIPTFDVPRNISVPSTAFNNNQGLYQISPIPFFNQTEFMVLMSDATGFATGGISELLTVGEPTAGASCNTTTPFLPFTFNLPSSLQQCYPYTFNEYDGAVLPVTITGFIPGGNFFMLHPPSTGTSYTWPTNDVAAGTRIIWAMTDANGNSGGASDAGAVLPSNIAGCLNSSSPSSTVGSTPSSASTSPSQTPSNSQTSSGISTGTTIGAAVGAVAVVAIIVALAMCYVKRQRYGRSPYGLASTRSSRRPNSVELDPGMDNLPHPTVYPFPYQSDSISRLPPSTAPGSSAALASYQGNRLTTTSVSVSEVPDTYLYSRSNSNTDSFAAFGEVASTSMSSSGRRKAAMAGIPAHQPTTRYIFHTDAEDDVPQGEPEIVELPPQYSEHRAPLIDHPEMPGAAEAASTDLAYLSGQHTDEPQRPSYHPPAAR